MDALDQFKAAQRAGWAHFAPLQLQTVEPAAHLVDWVGISAGQRVLDVACGTGVVSVTAARRGAHVTGLDLTPPLLEAARQNAALAGVAIDFHEGDVEALPFEASAFDVVVSQYGHIFAPRPDVAIGEMLRVLKPGGTIGFSTWPPDLMVGRIMALVGRHLPPPPPGVPPPTMWGNPAVIAERLGNRVRDLAFDSATMRVGALSPAHVRDMLERTAGPVIKLVESLSGVDPAKLTAIRSEMDALIATYFDGNVVRQGYLMTRAVKM